ncbi:hypothetical protein VTN02DRAFT_1840 [Thermoascus thermophilus]
MCIADLASHANVVHAGHPSSFVSFTAGTVFPVRRESPGTSLLCVGAGFFRRRVSLAAVQRSTISSNLPRAPVLVAPLGRPTGSCPGLLFLACHYAGAKKSAILMVSWLQRLSSIHCTF